MFVVDRFLFPRPHHESGEGVGSTNRGFETGGRGYMSSDGQQISLTYSELTILLSFC